MSRFDSLLRDAWFNGLWHAKPEFGYFQVSVRHLQLVQPQSQDLPKTMVCNGWDLLLIQ